MKHKDQGTHMCKTFMLFPLNAFILTGEKYKQIKGTKGEMVC